VAQAPCRRVTRPDDDEIDAYVKAVVDTFPPLTDQQRDLIALIFRSSSRDAAGR